MSGRRESSRTRSRSPFESSNFSTSPAETASASVRLRGQRCHAGLSETTVRLSSTRYCRGDALDVLQRDLLHRLEIIASEIEIAGDEPVRTQVRGLTAHGGERAKGMA